MQESLYRNYLSILSSELIPAMGCTEPIAVAFAGAKAREVLGEMPKRIQVYYSGNIIKNVMGVIVPNSGTLKGIDVAATLGVVGGDAGRELEVLSGITSEDIARTKRLVAQGFCHIALEETDETLYIRVEAYGKDNCSSAEIRAKHNHIARLQKNGQVLFEQPSPAVEEAGDRSLLNVRDILAFADELRVVDVKPVIDRQLQYNSAIAREGYAHPWGAQVGRTLLEDNPDNVMVRAVAAAACASDARMGGCALPVIINSGSGNQGITVSLPVAAYAKAISAPEDKLYRALSLANLILVHEKRFIGNLSAYCGASSAGCAAACAIAYLDGGTYDVIAGTIVNSIATIGGMVCDGAKSSCASKIASAVQTGLLGYRMARKGRVFKSGEGLVDADVEDTIRNVGRMGRVGMKSTDVEILHIMLGE